MKHNDTLWKGILESLCEDFLRFFFEDSERLFDFGKEVQFLDKELEQLFPMEGGEAPKFVDKLVKVFTRTGKEKWILIHIEVQGYQDRDFAKRMFTYFYRILDKYDKPVTAIVIFTDDNVKFHPSVYEYEYLGTRNTFNFNTFKVIEQEEESLSKDENPFAIVILTVLLALKKKKLDDESLFGLKYSLAKNLLQRNISKRKMDDLMIFLQLYVTFADSEYNVKFESIIDELTETWKAMSLREMVLDVVKKEGREEGIEKGKIEVVQNLLKAERFTIAEIANFANVTEEFVLNVKKTQI